MNRAARQTSAWRDRRYSCPLELLTQGRYENPLAQLLLLWLETNRLLTTFGEIGPKTRKTWYLYEDRWIVERDSLLYAECQIQPSLQVNTWGGITTNRLARE
jgi:hypothetical protein